MWPTGGLARGHAADDARDRRAHHVLVRHGSPWTRAARLRDGVWRTAGAAALPRPAAAAVLAVAAGFLACALPQAMDPICSHADGRTPRRRQNGRCAAKR